MEGVGEQTATSKSIHLSWGYYRNYGVADKKTLNFYTEGKRVGGSLPYPKLGKEKKSRPVEEYRVRPKLCDATEKRLRLRGSKNQIATGMKQKSGAVWGGEEKDCHVANVVGKCAGKRGGESRRQESFSN